MKFKQLSKVVPTLILIVLYVSIGFLWGKANCPACSVCPPSDVDMSLFWEAWKTLEENYVDQTKFDTQKMIYGAISGMVSSLDDPYTEFFNPEEAKQFIEDSQGSFEGVGMEIGIQRGEITVISPIDGSPAKKAGIRAGDIIVKIDGRTTANMKLDEAVKLIRGKRGTTVVVSIYRDEWQETRDIQLVRDVIELPSLKWSLKDNNIAYIQLYQFSEKAGDDFENAAFQILNSSAKSIVLDLRGNPGGYLHIAQDIAGWLIDKGQLITIEDEGADKPKIEYRSEGPSLLAQYPIVVLIDKGSASASEILAGALRDNRNIPLVGEKSYGKGSVQEIKPLSDGSSLKITIAKWLTPKGSQISDIGLTPDVEVKITSDDVAAQKDPQLEKALEIVKGLR